VGVGIGVERFVHVDKGQGFVMAILVEVREESQRSDSDAQALGVPGDRRVIEEENSRKCLRISGRRGGLLIALWLDVDCRGTGFNFTIFEERQKFNPFETRYAGMCFMCKSSSFQSLLYFTLNGSGIDWLGEVLAAPKYRTFHSPSKAINSCHHEETKEDVLQKELPVPDEAAVRDRVLKKHVDDPGLATDDVIRNSRAFRIWEAYSNCGDNVKWMIRQSIRMLERYQERQRRTRIS
jgi:hypothetical protein